MSSPGGDQAQESPRSGLRLKIEDAQGIAGTIEFVPHPGRDEGRAAGDPRTGPEPDAERSIQAGQIDRCTMLVASVVAERSGKEGVPALDVPKGAERWASTFVQAVPPPHGLGR